MPTDAERFQPADGEAPIRGHVRAVGHDRVTHGLFLPVVDDSRNGQQRQRHRVLHAWLQVVPESAVYTHVTAAEIYEWDTPQLPEHVPVFVAVGVSDPRPRREGLICSRLTRRKGAWSPRIVQGLPVDEPEEVLLRAARDLGVVDVLVMLDSALRREDLDPVRMRAILDSGRPGVGVLRSAYSLSSAKRETAGESIMAAFLAAMEVEVEEQVDVVNDLDQFVGRADFRVVGTFLLYEYDGAVHRDKLVHRKDLRRDRGLSETVYTRRGFTLDDLLNHAIVVMHEIDRDLSRPHRNRRFARWQVLVRESLYDECGRARLLNRWQRAMGVVQWA